MQEAQQNEPETQGTATKRKTMITTGAAGVGGTLIGLASHGPVGLFAGGVATLALLALEYHGTPEEYAKVVRPATCAVGRMVSRWRRNDVECVAPKDVLSLPRPAFQHNWQEEDEPMEALRPIVRPQLAAPAVSALRAPSQQKSYFTLSDVLRKGFRPSLQKIYLATMEDGTDVYARADQLCHVAGAGLTRGGKGHIKRSLMAQLCYAGAEVYLLDPKYTRWDRNSVDPTGRPCPEDWTPYTPFLQNNPMDLVPIATKYQVIEHYLKEAKSELDRRLEAYGYSRSTGRPMFLFLDEMPDIVDNIPNAQTYLKSILRMGAGVGVYIVCLSQDFLVKTLFPGEGGAVRDCFRTVFYVGGDPTTAKILLDMPAKDVPENNLGKGRIMLRCDVVRPAQLARFPYGDNQAIYDLLGPSTYVEPEEEEKLVSNLIGPQLKSARTFAQSEERHTDPLPVHPRRLVPVSAYDAHRQRLSERRRPAYARETVSVQTDPAMNAPESVPDDPESGLTQDERVVLVAYRSGLKTGNAIAGETGISSTRVNQALNKLARRGLIDWQPRKA